MLFSSYPIHITEHHILNYLKIQLYQSIFAEAYAFVTHRFKLKSPSLLYFNTARRLYEQP
ncbi:hypothetical protein BFC16_01020 [Pseudoalteromonas sp. JW3]|nr:hypothetical protein BFC16_01020 [Pseudoalteromonas sp. JW3]